MTVHVRPPQSTPAHRRTLRELVRAGCENKPGVYRMISESGGVVYVGQSKKVRTRLLSYFRAKGRRNKAARILRHAFKIEWEYTPTEFGALLRELRLIKQYRPHFNRMMVTDDWPRGYVALTGGAVPGLRVVSRSDYPDAVAMYGPFRKVRELRDAIQILAEFTGVRDCTIDDRENKKAARKLWFADSMLVSPSDATAGVTSRVAGCLRRDIGTCGAPCIGEARLAEYNSAVQQARKFLDGTSDSALTVATKKMFEAAERLEFERAGSLKARIEKLTWLHQRLQAFHASVDRLTFRYRTVGADGNEYEYLVRRGTVRSERVAPVEASDISSWNAEAQRIFNEADLTGADIPLHDLDEFHLVSSWFRRRPIEKARTSYP